MLKMVKIRRMLHEVVGRRKLEKLCTGDKIIKIIKENRSVKEADPHQKVVAEVVEVHPRTISPYLKGKGYRKWIAKKRPKQTAAHAAAGLNGLLREEIGLKSNGEIIFGVMSAVLKKAALGLLSGYSDMKVKIQIWLD